MVECFCDLGSGDVEFVRDTVIADLLRDKTALVFEPSGGGEDSLERSGGNRGFGVGRPGEEYVTEVEDEGGRLCERHGYVVGGGRGGS